MGPDQKERIQASRSGNDAHVDDADIRPINDEEPMAEVQTTAEINIFATGQQHTEQPEFINEGEALTRILKEVNSCAKVPSNKTTNRNKPVEQIRVATKPKRQIPKGHRFSINKTTTVHEKTTSPRSCLRWQPTGRILKIVCLRWVPTGKTFASSTTKVESEPPNGSNADIPNQCESEQALNVSAGTLLSTGTSFYPTEEGLRVWLRKRKISQKTGLQGILI
ncbi:hypothetical protein Tco_0429288 [Tanacetum coccineum]